MSLPSAPAAVAAARPGPDAAGERIVVIDDDAAMRLTCRQILARAGHEVEVCGDGAQGLAAVARLRPALVVVDLKMPGLSGLEVIARLRQLDPAVVVVVITGYATIETAVEAMKAGAYDFLPKPFSPDELRLIVARGSERRRLQLEASRLQVERALLERRFVAFVSHQLKGPLAAIHQYLDVLRRLEGDAGVEAKRRDWIDRCLQRSERMRALIDDWLTLARLESGQLTGRREAFDPAPLLRRLVAEAGERGAAAGIEVSLEEPPAGCRLEGDATSVGVLFENLLDNAVKYNRPGGTVRVAARACDGELVVEVRDSGRGIAPEALPQLFAEFYRGAPAGSGVAGSGLGLAICRRIASGMGGTIGVESEPGRGSTFTVRLPAAGPAPAVEAVAGALAAAPTGVR